MPEVSLENGGEASISKKRKPNMGEKKRERREKKKKKKEKKTENKVSGKVMEDIAIQGGGPAGKKGAGNKRGRRLEKSESPKT